MADTGNVAERVRANLRLWESCPFKFITNLWLNESKDTAILNLAYSPTVAGTLTVFISLHISTRAAPASFYPYNPYPPTFIKTALYLPAGLLLRSECPLSCR